MTAMDLITSLLLCLFVVLNVYITPIQPVPSHTGRCCRDGEPGIRGQKGSRGEKGDRGLPGTCTQQMVDRMNLTSDLRIRRRGDRRSDRSDGRAREEEEEGVKNMLTTLFETCVDDVLSGDEEESSAFGNRISIVKGEKGEKGDRGESIIGETGLPGPIGPIGPRGMKGERGEMGDVGSKGEQGVKGEKGREGPMGPMGIAGARGSEGPAGPAGLPGPQGERGQTAQTGLVYTRWAECTCPSDTTLLYDGIIVQAANMLTNLLCIPKDSTSSNQSGTTTTTTTTTPPSHITRMEPLLYTNRMGVTDAIPCALCHASNQSTIFTFSGRRTCPGDWTRQYSGYLTTSYELSTADVLCVDEWLSREIRWRDPSTGAVISNGVNMLETVCGEGVASCQGYGAGQLMPCVVCSN